MFIQKRIKNGLYTYVHLWIYMYYTTMNGKTHNKLILLVVSGERGIETE
jgi:hypothetical protein